MASATRHCSTGHANSSSGRSGSGSGSDSSAVSYVAMATSIRSGAPPSLSRPMFGMRKPSSDGSSSSSSSSDGDGGWKGGGGKNDGQQRASGNLIRLQAERAASAGAAAGVRGAGAAGRGVAGATGSRLGRQPSSGSVTRTLGDRGDREKSKDLANLQDKLKREWQVRRYCYCYCCWLFPTGMLP